MQLEKAHASSGEAGVIGWISSNDVTLFAMVLVVAVAIFLQSNLNKRSRLNTSLNAEVADLRNQLLQEQERLEQERARLLATSKSLAETTSQLDRTRADFSSLDAQRTQLDENLRQRLLDIQRLTEELNRLRLNRDELMETTTELTTEKGKLAQSKAEVDQNLRKLSAALTQKLRDLEDLQRERDLLGKKADALQDRVRLLERQLGDTEVNLALVKTSKDTELDDLRRLLERALSQSKDAEAKLRDADQKVAASAAETSRIKDRAKELLVNQTERGRLLQLQVDALKAQLANVLDQLEKSRQSMADQRSRGASIHRQLIGLAGDMKRVVVIVDSSGSMAEGNRWNDCQQIVMSWLEHLDVDECAMIVFSSNVRAFPADGRMLPVRGETGRDNRQWLLNQLRSVKPEGWTNTLEAMKKAYEYPGVDTILLFSDGAPTGPSSNKFDPKVADQIYALARRNSRIPVNTVGIGNYFDKDLSTFLRTLASHTGGAFMGR